MRCTHIHTFQELFVPCSRIFPLEEPIAINIEEIRKTYDLVLTRLQHLGYDKALNEALYKRTLGSIPRPLPSLECLRAYCFMMFHPSLKKFPECVKMLVPFIKVFLYLGQEEKETISEQHSCLFPVVYESTLLSCLYFGFI